MELNAVAFLLFIKKSLETHVTVDHWRFFSRIFLEPGVPATSGRELAFLAFQLIGSCAPFPAIALIRAIG